MNVFRVIFLKWLVWISQGIGNVIKYIQKNQHIALSDVKCIIINRKDRLGDAIITKPLIELLHWYLRSRGYRGKIKILASRYNHSVFDGMHSDIEIVTQENTFAEYAIGIFGVIGNSLKTLIKSLCAYTNIWNRKLHTVFLDFVWNPNDILENADSHMFVASANLFLNNFITHFSLSYSYVGGSSVNLIESYIALIEGVFGVDDFWKYVREWWNEVVWSEKEAPKNDRILLFVGNKPFRNLSISVWENIIWEIQKAFPKRKIVILDDHTNQVFESMMQNPDFPYKHLCQKNTFSLQEFQDFSRDFSLRIGVDGWGFNMIRMLGSSITLYTLGNAEVWSLFTGNPYMYMSLSEKYDAYHSPLWLHTIWYIKKKHFLLPSLDYSLGEDFFNDFPTQEFARYLRQFA